MAARFTLRRVSGKSWSFADDVRAGMAAVQKFIPPRYFYDDVGSALFEAICGLPEYYVTRAEAECLRRHAPQIAESLARAERIVELGAGSARKTRILLDQLTAGGHSLEYVPVDVDANMLDRVGHDLIAEYPSLSVTAICSDFTRPSLFLRDLSPRPTAVFFLGSTVGNLLSREAVALLADIHSVLSPGDAFLLGADLKKPKEILDAAYDDALGVTAVFNLNLLQRINRELEGHFDLRSFSHRAFYDEQAGRIEMHLVSLLEQSVRIDGLGLEVAFGEGETIHTENSHKYSSADLESLAQQSGFRLAQTWTDSKGWFADAVMVAE